MRNTNTIDNKDPEDQMGNPPEFTTPAATTSPTNGDGQEPEVEYDPLDLKNLCAGPASMPGLIKLPPGVSVRKPRSDEFVRIHPDPEHSGVVHLMKYEGNVMGDDKNVLWVVHPHVFNLIGDKVKLWDLYTTINTAGVVFLWPVSQAHDNTWVASTVRAVGAASVDWVKLVANTVTKEYETTVARSNALWGDPEWPDRTFGDMVKAAFKDNVIDSEDHPIVKAIIGAV